MPTLRPTTDPRDHWGEFPSYNIFLVLDALAKLHYITSSEVIVSKTKNPH